MSPNPRRGNAVDVRYMGTNGQALTGTGAYLSADVGRTQALIRLFDSAGFSSIYTGKQSRFGLIGGERAQRVHKNHIHFGRGRIDTVPW